MIKGKSFILIFTIGIILLASLLGIVMLRISYNRYRKSLEYANFIQGSCFANAGLSRLRYRLQNGLGDETFNFPDPTQAITISLDPSNNAATIDVQTTDAAVILDVTYQGSILTSYKIRKN